VEGKVRTKLIMPHSVILKMVVVQGADLSSGIVLSEDGMREKRGGDQEGLDPQVRYITAHRALKGHHMSYLVLRCGRGAHYVIPKSKNRRAVNVS
jgi:hypothetical protein